MKIIIDTSILIDHLRFGEKSKVIFTQIIEEKADLYIPTIIIYELFSGKSSANPQIITKINSLIEDFKRVELTEEIAQKAGILFRETGSHINAQDYIIAASALSLNAQVVTLNEKHFSQIPNLELYPL